MKPSALCILLACLLSACASRRAVSSLADHTISEIAVYEQALEDKINAEEGYYQAQSAKLAELQSSSSMTVHQKQSGAQARQGLVMLRIEGQAHRESISLIDKLLAQPVPATRSAIMQYVSEGIAEDQGSIEKGVRARREVRETLLKNLAELDADKETLEEAREALVQLREKKSFWNRLKDFISFAKETQKIRKSTAKPA
jgi:hypothetical protein